MKVHEIGTRWLKRILRFIKFLFVEKDAGDKVLKLLINTMRKDERLRVTRAG